MQEGCRCVDAPQTAANAPARRFDWLVEDFIMEKMTGLNEAARWLRIDLEQKQQQRRREERAKRVSVSLSAPRIAS